MSNCCEDKTCEIAALRARQSWVLKIVLLINSAMFIIEIGAGMAAHSTALLSDALDMLGDALVYGFSLYVIARDARWRAVAATLKGIVMVAFGLGVLLEAAYKVVYPMVPSAPLIGGIGLLALAANTACLVLLLRHRDDDLNMRSTWLCSRNDIIANVAVLLAAGGVAVSGSMWPDVAVGLGIAALFLHSAAYVLRRAVAELKQQFATP